MFFDEIIHGTQYYRSPTPLPEEWEEDIPNLEKYNLDAMQIRINWRNNEIREGEYDFSDVDKLMELAEKNNRKVIIKFLLECAPQYVFDKYDGVRIGPKGERLRGGYHGAFYGGWKPCFENPMVKASAQKFVDEVAKRYHGRKSIILWNVWNEPRNRPIEECFCPHCRKNFGQYLKDKFGTIEALNKHYGATEESFENINLPVMAHGVWDIFEFKKYKAGKSIYGMLRFVYDGIRKYDKTRPIMSHIGFTEGFQSSLTDMCDDYTVSKAVDFWGTSVPCDTTMKTPEARLDFQMLGDFLRSVDKNYFVHEIYPGLGMFVKYDEPYDTEFKLYSALGSGAKGMVYWQYRAERVGHEADCSGIMYMDGTPREVAYTVKNFGAELKKYKPFLANSDAESADVAIVFDFDCLLMSIIEDSCGADYTFDWCNPQFHYRNAHAGMYRLMRNTNRKVDYLGARDFDKFGNYKVLYFPYYCMIKPEVKAALEKFIANGGIVIADEGFGIRTTNTWMQPYDIDFKPVVTARMRTRRLNSGATVSYKGKMGSVRPFKTYYASEDGEVLATFDDGSAAMRKVEYGKGKLYLLGFSLAYGYYADGAEIWTDIVNDILQDANVATYAYADVQGGLYEKRLQSDDKQMIILQNASQDEKSVAIQEEILEATAERSGNTLFLKPNSTAILVVKS